MKHATKATKKRACPMCGKKFIPNTPWHKYDDQSCAKAAWDERQRVKIRTAEEIIRQRAGL